MFSFRAVSPTLPAAPEGSSHSGSPGLSPLPSGPQPWWGRSRWTHPGRAGWTPAGPSSGQLGVVALPGDGPGWGQGLCLLGGAAGGRGTLGARDRKRLRVETGLDFRQRRGLVGEGLVPVPPPPCATLCHTSPGEADVPLMPPSPPPASVAPERTRARRCLCRHLARPPPGAQSRRICTSLRTCAGACPQRSVRINASAPLGTRGHC